MDSVGSTPTTTTTTTGGVDGRPKPMRKYKRKKAAAATAKPTIEEKDIIFEETFHSELPETENDVMLGIKVFGEPGVCGTVRVEETAFGWSAKLSELRTLIQETLPHVRLENSRYPIKKSTKWHFLRPKSFKPVGRNQEPHCQARDWLPYITILPEFAKEDLEEILYKSLRPTRPAPLSNGVYPSNILLKSQCYSFPPAVRHQARVDLMKHISTGVPVEVVHARAESFDREVARAQRDAGYTGERLAMSIASGAGGSLSSTPRVSAVRAKKSASASRKRFMTPDFRSASGFVGGSGASNKPKRFTAAKKRKKAKAAPSLSASPNLRPTETNSHTPLSKGLTGTLGGGDFATPVTTPNSSSVTSPLTLPANVQQPELRHHHQHVAELNQRSGNNNAIGAEASETTFSS